MTIKTTPFDVEITELEGQIKTIQEAQINPLQVKLNEQLQRRAEYLCPFKIGDMVVRTLRVGFKNKEIVARARVSQIRDNFYGGYDVLGIRIFKDGTEGQEIHFYHDDHWAKEGDDNGRKNLDSK